MIKLNVLALSKLFIFCSKTETNTFGISDQQTVNVGLFFFTIDYKNKK